MTPFDPDALVAMLMAFYPAVSAAAFAQARRERPSYFANGVIVGTSGDKLRLPDGRIFDCIFAVDGPANRRRWIAIDVTDAPPGPPDPFPLETGPLDPIDEDTPIFPGGEASFESLVAGELGALDGADDLLDHGAGVIAAFGGADELDGEFRATLEPAIEAHERTRRALDDDDPAFLLDAANSHDAEIDSARIDYVEEEEPDIYVPDPGPKPRDDDDGPPPRDPGGP